MDDLVITEPGLELLNAFRSPSVRKQIMDIQKFVQEMPQVEMPRQHTFAPGVYVGQMDAPAGAVIVGKIHKTEHVVIIAQGEASILTDEGVQRFTAPCTFVAKPGAKRVIYVHQDLVMINVHPTDETDLEKIEAEIIAPDFEALDKHLGTLLIKGD
jgi:hypothetical protein